MSFGEKSFAVAIRIVFIAAFAAFLLASLRHIAVFFQAYEPVGSDSSWSAYALAWSIDGTALVLTIGEMFFGKKMSLSSKIAVWFFIVALTGFSWLVNWEYAATYQSTTLTSHLPGAFQDINPVLASSFAFLNMAYSIIAGIFSRREPTLAELQEQLDSLTGERARLIEEINRAKGPGFIDRTKDAAIKAKSALSEIAAAGARPEETPDAAESAPEETPEQSAPAPAPEETQVSISEEEPREEKPAFDLPTLGFIEQSMLDKLMEAPAQKIAELRDLAAKKPLPELTTDLQKMYPAYAGYITEKRVKKVMEVFLKSDANFDEKPEQNLMPDFNENAPQNWQDFSPVYGPNLPPNLVENDQEGHATDPEISRQDSGELYSVELPEDPNENGQPTTEFEAIIGLKGQVSWPEETPAQTSAAPALAPKKGLTYREAAKLPICLTKDIRVGDIRAAVRGHRINTFKDGSVSKSAVEKWARTVQKDAMLNGIH